MAVRLVSVVAATLVAVSLVPAYAGLSFTDKLHTVDMHIKACQQATAGKILATPPRPSTPQEQQAQELRRIDLLLEDSARLPEALTALEALLAVSGPQNDFFRQQVAVLLFNTYFEAGRYDDVVKMAQGAEAIYPAEIAALGEIGRKDQVLARAGVYLLRAKTQGYTSAEEVSQVTALAQLASVGSAKPGAYAALIAARRKPLQASRIALKPIALVAPKPVYPKKAARKKIEGYVDVEITVAADGSVTQTRVLHASPDRIFDKAAMEAAKRSVFVPGYEGCKPTVTTGVRRYNFTFSDPATLPGLEGL